MKNRLFVLSLLLLSLSVIAKPKQQRVTAVFHVPIECDHCVRKIQDNIAFEKGLKDMQIDKNAQTVTLTWDPEKTDTTMLKTAFLKISKPVSRIQLLTAEKPAK